MLNYSLDFNSILPFQSLIHSIQKKIQSNNIIREFINMCFTVSLYQLRQNLFFLFSKGPQETAVTLYFDDFCLQLLTSLLVSLRHCGKDPSRRGASQISAHTYVLHCWREKHHVMEVQLGKDACVHPAFRERPRERGQGKDIPQAEPSAPLCPVRLHHLYAQQSTQVGVH